MFLQNRVANFAYLKSEIRQICLKILDSNCITLCTPRHYMLLIKIPYLFVFIITKNDL